jgi:hypothetical protein
MYAKFKPTAGTCQNSINMIDVKSGAKVGLPAQWSCC